MNETQDQNMVAKYTTSVKPNLPKVIAQEVPNVRALNEEIVVSNLSLTGNNK